MKFPGGKYPPLLILMTVLFGLSFIATKNALQGLGIFQLVFLRYLFAFILLSLILWRDRQKFFIARKDWKHFLLLTLIEPVGYFIFETYGVRFTSPANVSLIIATIPVFTILFALWILKEKSSWLAVLGIPLTLMGVYFIVTGQSATSLAPNPLLGNFFTLGAAISAAMYNVQCRRLTRTYSPLTITYYQAMIATIVFLPLAGIETSLKPDSFLNLDILLNIFYLSFGSSVAAYLLLNYTLSRLETYQVAIFANLVPVVTIFASWVVYGDMMKPVQFAGAFLILAGIYLAYARRRPADRNLPQENI